MTTLHIVLVRARLSIPTIFRLKRNRGCCKSLFLTVPKASVQHSVRMEKFVVDREREKRDINHSIHGKGNKESNKCQKITEISCGFV